MSKTTVSVWLIALALWVQASGVVDAYGVDNILAAARDNTLLSAHSGHVGSEFDGLLSGAAASTCSPECIPSTGGDEQRCRGVFRETCSTAYEIEDATIIVSAKVSCVGLYTNTSTSAGGVDEEDITCEGLFTKKTVIGMIYKQTEDDDDDDDPSKNGGLSKDSEFDVLISITYTCGTDYKSKTEFPEDSSTITTTTLCHRIEIKSVQVLQEPTVQELVAQLREKFAGSATHNEKLNFLNDLLSSKESGQGGPDLVAEVERQGLAGYKSPDDFLYSLEDKLPPIVTDKIPGNHADHPFRFNDEANDEDEDEDDGDGDGGGGGADLDVTCNGERTTITHPCYGELKFEYEKEGLHDSGQCLGRWRSADKSNFICQGKKKYTVEEEDKDLKVQITGTCTGKAYFAIMSEDIIYDQYVPPASDVCTGYSETISKVTEKGKPEPVPVAPEPPLPPVPPVPVPVPSPTPAPPLPPAPEPEEEVPAPEPEGEAPIPEPVPPTPEPYPEEPYPEEPYPEEPYPEEPYPEEPYPEEPYPEEPYPEGPYPEPPYPGPYPEPTPTPIIPPIPTPPAPVPGPIDEEEDEDEVVAIMLEDGTGDLNEYAGTW